MRQPKVKKPILNEEEVGKIVQMVEEQVMEAIQASRRKIEKLYGDGYTEIPEWTAAVNRLHCENRDYRFHVEKTTVCYNNYDEALASDYVMAKEWWEPFWKLTVEW